MVLLSEFYKFAELLDFTLQIQTSRTIFRLFGSHKSLIFKEKVEHLLQNYCVLIKFILQLKYVLLKNLMSFVLLHTAY